MSTYAEDGAEKVKVTGPIGLKPVGESLATVSSATTTDSEILEVLKRIDDKLGFLIEATTGAKLC